MSLNSSRLQFVTIEKPHYIRRETIFFGEMILLAEFHYRLSSPLVSLIKDFLVFN